MGVGKKMCKYKTAKANWRGGVHIQCNNPDIPSKAIMTMEEKECCRRLCPYYESR